MCFHPTHCVRKLMYWLGCALLSTSCWSQSTEIPPPGGGLREIDLYVARNNLSTGYSNWSEEGVRGIYEISNHQFAGELANMNRFNESGIYAAVQDTVLLNADWFASMALGGGDGAAYLPKYRIDGFIHRKFLEDRQLIGSFGLGYYRSPDSHRDDNASLGFTYYTSLPWVIQAQAKRTRSLPGDIVTHQYFVAATWGSYKNTLITGRHGWGREGYQSLGDALSIARFDSHETSLAIKHWIAHDWGFRASVEQYTNPYYHRNGIQISLFKDLQ
jgi:YaiO family outer membrane protein